ncbi:MAG: hypothetical protein B6U69_04205 [Thermofilum sp. ex4484_15]|nr:MAG: hypothetical protein B6U69_04205 [Thermofilum sp. ex4484_15]
MGVKEELLKVGRFPEQLGLDLNSPSDRFKWFLASMLFAKRISSDIAERTFKAFVKEGLTTPDKILKANWDKLVEVLDSGGYVRYDFSTATNILESMKLLKERYGGDLEKLHEVAKGPRDLERKLMEFRGIGPIAVNIFLRELRGIWSKADPKPSHLAFKVAKRIGIKEEEVKEYEPYLVKLAIKFCKKNRCKGCPVKTYCRKQN